MKRNPNLRPLPGGATSKVLPHVRDRTDWGEANDLLQVAVRTGGIGVYVTDFEQGVTRLSPELCTILGLPAGTELSYAQASRLFDERDQAAVRVSVEAAVKSTPRGRWDGVHRVVRADGAVRWVSIRGQRIYRETVHGSKPVRSIGTVIDITESKEVEEALREQELRLRLALDAAQMGTFEADLAANQVIVDAQQARLFGLPADSRVISVSELRNRVRDDSFDLSDAKRRRLTKAREACHHEFVVQMPDGSERWLSAYADIRSNRLFGVSFDVSERKRAEVALRESEARLRLATTGAALGVFEWDAQTDHAVWENDRMYEIFGRDRALGPISKRLFVEKYLHPDDVRDFEAALEQSMTAGGRFHVACRINLDDRSRRHLEIDGKFGATGHTKRLLGIVADVTGRKRLERKARRLSERLTTVQDEERQRIAQELHDSTVQHLVACSLTLMKLRSAVPVQAEQEPLWEDVEQTLQYAMKELRTFSYLMNPPILQGGQLCSALQQYIDGFASRSGLHVRLRANAKIDNLILEVQRSLLRIVQEALANVYHHAAASRVCVDLRWIGKGLHFVITDNGRGIHSPSTLDSGLGLRGIRARLKHLGDSFRIIRRKESGTRLHGVIALSEGQSRLADVKLH
jgi:PAS domain S-box-containing protein